LSEELLKRLRRTEVSVSYNWQPWCPSARALSNIDVGSYRWCPWHPAAVDKGSPAAFSNCEGTSNGKHL
jgi:hypothetical protein